MLEWIDARYAHPPIYITENGCALPGEGDREVALNDVTRRDFLKGYLEACHEAISNGLSLPNPSLEIGESVAPPPLAKRKPNTKE